MGRGGSGIEPRGNSIRLKFMFRGIWCRETLKMKPTAANMKFAAGMKAEIERHIAMGTFRYSDYFPNSKRAAMFDGSHIATTVAERITNWLERRKKDTATSTWHSYETAVRCYLVPFLGQYKIRELTTEHVRAMIATMEVSNKRINNVLIPLRGVMGDAHADGLIEKNPMGRIRNLKVRTRDPEPFDAEGQRAIIEAARENANTIQFDFWTGLRIGELIALRWPDIDFTSGQAHIRNNNVRGEMVVTKTEAADRTIDLLPPALEALKRQKAITYLQGDHVFVNPNNGQPWRDDIQFRQVAWVPTIRRAKVAYREPKQMRHTYASMMLTAGENIAAVSRQLGHTSIQTTLKTYARWIPKAATGYGSKAIEMFSNEGGNSPSIAQKENGNP